MISHKITLGDPQEDQKILRELIPRYHKLMTARRHGEADQIRQEALRRLDRLPAGIMKAYLTRKLYEG